LKPPLASDLRGIGTCIVVIIDSKINAHPRVMSINELLMAGNSGIIM
jgi:hypothetical protein